MHTLTPVDSEANGKHEPKQVLIPFDSVVVNVADGRYTRYLRGKISLVVDVDGMRLVKDAVEKEKPFLQTWVSGIFRTGRWSNSTAVRE